MGCKLNSVRDLVEEKIDIITVNVLKKTIQWNPMEDCRILNRGANVEIFTAA